MNGLIKGNRIISTPIEWHEPLKKKLRYRN